MLTAAQAKLIADAWVRAWNSHDLDKIMAFYAPDAVVTTPAAVALLGIPSGTVTGPAVRDFFRKALEQYTYLNFQQIELMWGVSSIVVYYANHRGTRTCELLDLGADGKIVRSVANYSG